MPLGVLGGLAADMVGVEVPRGMWLSKLGDFLLLTHAPIRYNHKL